MNDPRRWLERWGVVILVAFLFLLELVLAYRIILLFFSSKLLNQIELITLSVLIVVIPLLIFLILKLARYNRRYDVWESLMEHIDGLRLDEKEVENLLKLFKEVVSIIETGDVRQSDSKEVDSGSAGLE